MEKKKWYAVYTKPRWEKKVNQLLRDKGIETYCPLNKIRRKWSDRMKTLEEPLFKSYVFVRVTEDQKSEVRMTNGAVNFVYWLGKPAIIKDKEIEFIQRFLNEYETVEAEAVSIQPNQKVTFQSGVWLNYQGTVIKVFNNRAVVFIESLGYHLTFSAKKNVLVPITNSNEK